MFADLVERLDSLIVIVSYQQLSFQYIMALDLAVYCVEL